MTIGPFRDGSRLSDEPEDRSGASYNLNVKRAVANVLMTDRYSIAAVGCAYGRCNRRNELCTRYRRFASRKSGGLTSVKTTSSSPVTVLMSWCMLTTLTPVICSTITSMTDLAVSIR